MLVSRTGVRIEFKRLDEWIVQVIVSIPATKGDKVVASPKFTLGQIKGELAACEHQPYENQDN